MKARLRSVASVPEALYDPRPEWAYPNNEHAQKHYIRAIAFLRRGRKTRWICDTAAPAPGWRANPPEVANGTR